MSEQWRERIGKFGVWRAASQTTPALAERLESLGFGALWLGGSPSADLTLVDQLLGATTTLVVATGIVNVWRSKAEQVAASFARIESRCPGRFLLGVGVGHPEATADYAKPYETLVRYVDVLTGSGVPPQAMVLAALGPRVLRLAADRTAGAHPYLVPADYTRLAREILGAEPLLAPEHKAVIDTDAQAARAIGRSRVRTPYLGLVNYTSNLRRLGWTDADMADGGSDALIDALVAHGSPEQVAAGLNAHLSAGADHVCVQLFSETGGGTLDDYGKLATGLGLAG
jgi:probable F420-dependent oxidoreductase